LLDELLGERAPVVLEGLLRFEAAHPHDEPHRVLREQLLADALEGARQRGASPRR
jgi:hypothetical protein